MKFFPIVIALEKRVKLTRILYSREKSGLEMTLLIAFAPEKAFGNLAGVLPIKPALIVIPQMLSGRQRNYLLWADRAFPPGLLLPLKLAWPASLILLVFQGRNKVPEARQVASLR